MPNKKKKRKATDTKVKDPNFIRFSEVQKKLLKEVWVRTTSDRNVALEAVFKDLEINEKVKQIPAEMVSLRMGDEPTDILGLDILLSPPRKPDLPPSDLPLDPLKGEKPPGKSGKDN